MSENPGRHLSDCEMSTKKFAMGKKPMVNAPGTERRVRNVCFWKCLKISKNAISVSSWSVGGHICSRRGRNGLKNQWILSFLTLWKRWKWKQWLISLPTWSRTLSISRFPWKKDDFVDGIIGGQTTGPDIRQPSFWQVKKTRIFLI